MEVFVKVVHGLAVLDPMDEVHDIWAVNASNVVAVIVFVSAVVPEFVFVFVFEEAVMHELEVLATMFHSVQSIFGLMSELVI